MDGDQPYRFSPRKDTNHLWNLLTALAMVKAQGTTPLTTLMAQEGGNLSAGTVAMIVAPRPGDRIGSLMQFMIRRGILVVPIFLDAPSFGRSADGGWWDDGPASIQEWAVVIRRGDDLSTPLSGVLDRLAIY